MIHCGVKLAHIPSPMESQYMSYNQKKVSTGTEDELKSKEIEFA